MKYSYFPGCSLKGLGRAYEESLLPVMQRLGVELVELDGDHLAIVRSPGELAKAIRRLCELGAPVCN